MLVCCYLYGLEGELNEIVSFDDDGKEKKGYPKYVWSKALIYEYVHSDRYKVCALPNIPSQEDMDKSHCYVNDKGEENQQWIRWAKAVAKLEEQ